MSPLWAQAHAPLHRRKARYSYLYRSASLAAPIIQRRQIGVLADLAGSSFGWSIGALHRLDASTKLPSLCGSAHNISVPPWRAQLVGWLYICVITSHAI